jgi:hypothetical protein
MSLQPLPGPAGLLVAAVFVTLSTWGAPARGQTFEPPAALNAAASDGTRDDGFPRIASDGGNTVVAVWDSQRAQDPVFGSDRDVFFVRSTDGGQSWEPTAPLNTNAGTDGLHAAEHRPVVATDGALWVALWRTTDLDQSGQAIDQDIAFALSPDGRQWTAPAALDPSDTGVNDGDDNTPEVATDRAGTWVAVWDDGAHVFASRFTVDTLHWSAPQALDQGPPGTENKFPNVATDGHTWVVVWSGTNLAGPDRDIGVVTSTDDGLHWSAPTALNSYAASDVSLDLDPRVATDGAGNWIAVWSDDCPVEGEPPDGAECDVAFATTLDPVGGWGQAGHVNTNWQDDTAQDEYPRVVSDGPGVWVVVWDAEGLFGTDDDIAIARSLDNGAHWSPPGALNTTAPGSVGDDEHPDVTRDGQGRWIAVWQSNDKLGGTLGSDADLDILFARASDGLCGDGDHQGNEQCDLGASDGAVGSCCSVDCTLREKGRVCRPAIDECDTAEVCSGSTERCPADRFAASGTPCPGGTCDGDGTCAVPGGTSTTTTTSLTATTVVATSTSTTTTSSTTSTTTTRPLRAVCGDGVVEAGEKCDLGPENGSSASCCTRLCTRRPAGQVCRSSVGACDLAESCDGSSPACPADAKRADGDRCDDGDPDTTTSACRAGLCEGVHLEVDVRPPPSIPRNVSPDRIAVPFTLKVPAGAGGGATAELQGFAECNALVLPALGCDTRACRNSRMALAEACGPAIGGTATPGRVAVTSRFSRVFAEPVARTVRGRLRLDALGHALFRKDGGLDFDVIATLRDREGRAITARFPIVLQRR